MNIYYKNPENISKKNVYLMTKDPSCKSVKNISDNEEFIVSEILQYTDTNSKGEGVDIMAMMTDLGPMACQSQTFREQMRDIIEIFGLPVKIKKISGTTKAGREYITCTYAGE